MTRFSLRICIDLFKISQIIFVLLVLNSCRPVEIEREPKTLTGSVLEVSGTKATISGQIINVGTGNNYIAWYDENSENQLHKCGLKVGKTNSLQDILGNAMEWCSDWYDPNYYSISPTDNPQGPENGTLKVVRGGSYKSEVYDCRNTARKGLDPEATYPDVGFRFVGYCTNCGF